MTRRTRVFLVAVAGSALAGYLAAHWLVSEPATVPQVEPAPYGADPAAWGRRFPEHYEAYRRARTDDFGELRGHAWSLKDREETEQDSDPLWKRILAGRPRVRPLPAGCLECHAGADPAPLRNGSYYEARTAARHPVSCVDCHEPESLRLRTVRGLPAESSGRALRTLVCAQCHSEYRFADGGQVSRPSSLSVAADWTHAETGAPVVDVRHPQFEMWSRGLHARSGADCTDCHMPRVRKGALRMTDHHAASPRQRLETACLGCHRSDTREMEARIDAVQQRTRKALAQAKQALAEAIDAIGEARATGAPLQWQAEAQMRIAYVAADRSNGFHAPEESMRLLLEAIDFARRAHTAARARR